MLNSPSEMPGNLSQTKITSAVLYSGYSADSLNLISSSASAENDDKIPIETAIMQAKKFFFI